MNPAKDSAAKSKNRSQWKRIDKYAIQNPPWRISMSYVDGNTMYVVWKDGTPGPLAFKEDLDDCFDWIEHEKD
jgi:hypothetical protein